MDLDQIEVSWKQLKGNIQHQLAKLTEYEIDVASGKQEALAVSVPHSMLCGMGNTIDSCGEPSNDESDEMDDSGKHKHNPAPKPMPNPIPDEMDVSKVTKK